MKSPLKRTTLSVTIIVVLIALASSPSLAEGKKGNAKAAVESSDAKEARERGIVALNLGRYEEAARSLEKAYELSRNPEILFSLVTAYRLAGKPEQALALCASFLRSTDSLASNGRALIERTVAELSIIVEQMHLHPTESAPVSRPAVPVAQVAPIEPTAPTVVPPPIPAVEPQIEKKEAAPAPVVKVVPQASERTDLLASKLLPPPEKHRPFYRSVWFWTAVGVAVAAGTSLLIYEATRNPGPPSTTLGAQRMF